VKEVEGASIGGLGRFVLAVFLLVGLEALFAVPELSWELAVPGREGLGTALSLGVAALAAVFLWKAREPVLARLEPVAARLAAVPRGRWLAGILLLGLALRLAWALAFPVDQTSDAETYFDLGAQLARGEAYVTPNSGTRAEWPPGLPFLLALTFRLVGIGNLAVVLLNLALCAATLPVVDALARRLAGEGPARLATLLFALWPNLITSTGIANKEGVATLALTLSFLLHVVGQESRSAGRRWPAWSGAGLALGVAVLTQPAMLLLPAAFVVADLLGRVPLRRAVPAWGLLVAGMALIIGPWMLRNDQVLGRPVLTTNGGSVFYRANNPRATGGWVEHGEKRLDHLGELEASDAGYRWGMTWVRENPDDFLALAVRKQILFLGDDAVGVYETLKRGLGREGPLYAVLKLLASGWWWCLWLLILLGLSPWWPRGPEGTTRALPAGLLLLLLAFLYTWAIDSVFESGSRHHAQMSGVVAVLAALPLAERRAPHPPARKAGGIT
jgi:4-amino-4-deoxy-L-arabinose transferase-like glycosyltransferase